MIDDETGEKAKPFTEGNKLYQVRARAALPLLVRQAKAQKTIYYGDLAKELHISNARILNYVLGSVGVTLIRLAKTYGWEIPPVQCLVINRTTKLPGEGVGFFIDKEKFKQMSAPQRRAVVNNQLAKIFSYTKWDAVLKAFQLPPAPMDYHQLVQEAAVPRFGGGESEAHRQLKLYIAKTPSIVGLSVKAVPGNIEHPLPSGDRLDVLFQTRNEWVAVEVKSEISDDADIARGMFQCVKYQAVLEAFLISTNRPPNARAVLVVGRPLPALLLSLKHTLGVKVVEVLNFGATTSG